VLRNVLVVVDDDDIFLGDSNANDGVFGVVWIDDGSVKAILPGSIWVKASAAHHTTNRQLLLDFIVVLQYSNLNSPSF